MRGRETGSETVIGGSYPPGSAFADLAMMVTLRPAEADSTGHGPGPGSAGDLTTSAAFPREVLEAAIEMATEQPTIPPPTTTVETSSGWLVGWLVGAALGKWVGAAAPALPAALPFALLPPHAEAHRAVSII